MKKWLALLVVAICLYVPIKADAYYTKGNKIYNDAGQEMVWNGVNWFGFETHNYAPHGLWSRTMDEMLDQLKREGYNLIRVPYSNDIFKAVTPNGIDFYKNAALQNKQPIEILDILVAKAKARDMYILLDRHRPDANGQSELWYTATVSEAQWIRDWVMLAKRYKGNPTVIGADLHNEPHGQASWGTGDTKTDWRLAAERAGNAILATNPSWLIVVEGVEKNVQGESGNYWWGGNLKGVKNYPIRLNVSNKVVYSTHDYGQGVYNQPWFSAPNFPGNMTAIWDSYWGYIHKQQIAPVLIGEFGGRAVDVHSNEGKWQRALVQYIKQHNLYWTYWSLNPNSGDTGGLLQDDWYTWQREKQQMLAPIMRTQPISDGTFTDVPKKHPYYAQIQAMYELGVITGYTDGSFRPTQAISRQHVAKMLTTRWTFEAKRAAVAFRDVPSTHPYYEAIQELYMAGIIDGTNGAFKPSATITRAQLAKIFVLAFELKSTGTVPQFKDVPQDAWYAQYVSILAASGITTGDNGYFKPNEPVSRAHFAVFLQRINAL